MKKIGNSVPAIVFDLGGVLMDWNPRYLYCEKLGVERELVDQFLAHVDFFEWNKELDRGRPFSTAISDLSTRFPQYSRLIRAYDEYYLDTVKGSFPLVVDILARLKRLAYPLYALSNWPAEKFYQVRPQHAFFDWFDGMLISGDVHLIKPDHAIYRLLLERIGRAAEECVFIDDNADNIESARRIGFQTVQFQSAHQLEAELNRLGILINESEHTSQVA